MRRSLPGCNTSRFKDRGKGNESPGVVMRYSREIRAGALFASGLLLGCNAILDLSPGRELCDGVTCMAPDACHIGVCDPNTGKCKAEPDLAPPGTACDDGDPCTTKDSCQGGMCIGGGPATDGMACHDGDLCTPSQKT